MQLTTRQRTRRPRYLHTQGQWKTPSTKQVGRFLGSVVSRYVDSSRASLSMMTLSAPESGINEKRLDGQIRAVHYCRDPWFSSNKRPSGNQSTLTTKATSFFIFSSLYFADFYSYKFVLCPWPDQPKVPKVELTCNSRWNTSPTCLTVAFRRRHYFIMGVVLNGLPCTVWTARQYYLVFHSAHKRGRFDVVAVTRQSRLQSATRLDG